MISNKKRFPKFNIDDIVIEKGNKIEMTIIKIIYRTISLKPEDITNPIFTGQYKCQWHDPINQTINDKIFQEQNLIKPKKKSFFKIKKI